MAGDDSQRTEKIFRKALYCLIVSLVYIIGVFGIIFIDYLYSAAHLDRFLGILILMPLGFIVPMVVILVFRRSRDTLLRIMEDHEFSAVYCIISFSIAVLILMDSAMFFLYRMPILFNTQDGGAIPTRVWALLFPPGPGPAVPEGFFPLFPYFLSAYALIGFHWLDPENRFKPWLDKVKYSRTTITLAGILLLLWLFRGLIGDPLINATLIYLAVLAVVLLTNESFGKGTRLVVSAVNLLFLAVVFAFIAWFLLTLQEVVGGLAIFMLAVTLLLSPLLLYCASFFAFFLNDFWEKAFEDRGAARPEPAFINVHCHLLNFEYVSETFLKGMLKNAPIPLPISNWVIRFPFLVDYARRVLNVFLPGLHRLSEFRDLFERPICGAIEKRDGVAFEAPHARSGDGGSVCGALGSEMDEAGIKVAVPLMMDLGAQSYNSRPMITYEQQIDEISAIARGHGGRLLPFVMFDPRRENALDLVKDAIESKGFIGVKVYPSLGYNPNPDENPDGEVAKRLKRLYLFCAKNKVPITTHCSRGGAEPEFGRPEELHALCDPANWEKVVQSHPGLYVNLGHFGNDLIPLDGIAGAKRWCLKIRALIENPEYHVYTDVSCNTVAFDQTAEYFRRLKAVLASGPAGGRVLFGTDWMMARMRHTEKDWVDLFKENLKEDERGKKGVDGLQGPKNEDLMTRIARTNTLSFLFPEGKMLKETGTFYGENSEALKWLRERGGITVREEGCKVELDESPAPVRAPEPAHSAVPQ